MKIEVCAGSSMSLSGIDANAILVTSKKIDIDGNSSFEVDTWDDNNSIVNSVVIQPPQGETGQIQVESNSNLDFEVGGTIVMNVQLNNSSHMYTGSNTVIDGGLFVSTYSSYFAENSNIVADPGTFNKSVSGGITCYNSQATDIDNSNSIYRSICPTN
ncbi:hypothetical protein [Isorropodon fossajaponicum symbiont]|uniref:hypothetical protein n=1 Tax=Isorropodon fossajaponicum symbiont TaxID=883811 RepID=UPI00191503A3|nr:hypothetical protein [Isorropodon fossajaponicum symbiont]